MTLIVGRSDHSSANNLISMDYDTSSAQDEIEPLTGHPCFTLVLSPTNVKPRFQMIPSRKLVKILPSAGVPVVFHCRGKRWEMKYCGHRPFKSFETWKNFAVDNNLKVGDALVFELTDPEKMEFKVQILKGEIPSVAHPCREKGSSASPIVID